MVEQVDCPRCEKTNDVPEEYIGRYFTCPYCRCRYYIPVPNAQGGASHAIVERPRPTESATLDDLLRDSQEGQGAILRVLREQQRHTESLLCALSLARWLLAAFVILSVVELGVLFALLMGR